MNIYFDNASVYTTSQHLKNKLITKLSNFFADSEQQHFLSLKSKAEIEESRILLSKNIKSSAHNIFFISGLNDIILLFEILSEKLDFGSIITSVFEEPAILETYKKISHFKNVPLIYTKHLQDSTLYLENLKTLLKNNPKAFVSLSHVNRLTGRLLQISRISKFIHQADGIFHCNMSHSIGKYLNYPEDLEIDIVSANSQYFNGIKNTGFVYLNNKILSKAQKSIKRIFSENNDPALISTMCYSVETCAENLEKNFKYVDYLNTVLFNELKNSGIKFNSQFFEKHHFSPYIVNLELTDYQNIDNLFVKFDLNDIYVTNSRLLYPEYGSNIRISFSESNTEEEIKWFTDILKNKTLNSF